MNWISKRDKEDCVAGKGIVAVLTVEMLRRCLFTAELVLPGCDAEIKCWRSCLCTVLLFHC